MTRGHPASSVCSGRRREPDHGRISAGLTTRSHGSRWSAGRPRQTGHTGDASGRHRRRRRWRPPAPAEQRPAVEVGRPRPPGRVTSADEERDERERDNSEWVHSADHSRRRTTPGGVEEPRATVASTRMRTRRRPTASSAADGSPWPPNRALGRTSIARRSRPRRAPNEPPLQRCQRPTPSRGRWRR